MSLDIAFPVTLHIRQNYLRDNEPQGVQILENHAGSFRQNGHDMR